METMSTAPQRLNQDTADSTLGSSDVIVDAKAYLQVCNAADGGNRDESLDDLRFLSGQQWPELVQRQREVERRPCLTINKLPTFLHQVTNDQRMNVPSIKVSAVDGEADVKTAEVLQGYIRHIEYSSNADICYDTAVNSAAAIGFGYFRIVTEYCDPKSFDQDIRFKRIRNSFTVYFDPMSQEPDGSDQRRCLLTEKLTLADFKKQYPEAQQPGSAGFQTGAGDSTNRDWFGADFVRVAEFYRIEEEADELVLLPDGTAEFKSVLEEQGVVIAEGTKTRPTTRPKTMLYKLTAVEVLESTEVKCKWIPVFPVYGDEIDVDGIVIRSGIIRNAKDPAQMYNFWMTAATEEVALRPKTPYVGAEGQFEGYEDDWNDANVKSFSYLEYKPVELNGNMAPPPARQPMADMPQGMLTMAMHANDNIKATTGLFDSSLGAMGNARSGTQERSQQRQGDMANFHFTDNLNRTIRHAGRCIINMIPHYIDAPRIIKVMGEDGKVTPQAVNQPALPNGLPAPPPPDPAAAQPQAPGMLDRIKGLFGGGAPQPQQQPGAEQNEQTQAVETILHDLTVGEYDVVVKAGPSYSTLREEAADSMIEFGKSWPKLMDIAGDKIIRAMDWPGAEEIADRVEKTIPAELRTEETDPEAPVVQTPKGPIPVDQAAQMLQEMDQQIQGMTQELQKLQGRIPQTQIKAEADVKQTQIDADTRVKVAEIQAVSSQDVAELNGLVKLLIAKLQPPPGLEQEALTPGATPT